MSPFRSSPVADTSKPAKGSWEGQVAFQAVASREGVTAAGPHASVRLEHRWPAARGGAAATLATDDLSLSAGKVDLLSTEVFWKGGRDLHFHLAGGRTTPGDALVRTDCGHGHGLMGQCGLTRRGSPASPRAVMGAAVLRNDVTAGVTLETEGARHATAFAQAIVRPAPALTLGLVAQRRVFANDTDTDALTEPPPPLQVVAHGSAALGDQVALSGWVQRAGAGAPLRWSLRAASAEALSRWGWGFAFEGRGRAEDIGTEFCLRWRPGDGVSVNPGVSFVLRNYERFEEPRAFLQLRWDVC